MPYNLLTMSQAVAQDAGLSGDIGTINGATGDRGRVVRYVKEASLAIENRWHDWKFLYQAGTPFSFVNGVVTVAAPSDLKAWNKDRFYIEGVHVPHGLVLEYHEWQPCGDMGSGRPTYIVIMPDNSLSVYPTPDRDYAVQADYYRTPKELVSDTDIPNIPQRFGVLIQAYAMKSYAAYDAAQELMAKAQQDIDLWDVMLENDQRPGGSSSGTSYGNNIVISAE